MKVTIRMDASTQVGTGHAMRCVALAECLAEAGHGLQVATAAIPRSITGRFEKLGAVVVQLEESAGSIAECDETVELARDSAWTVLDGYQFDAHYRSKLGLTSQLLWIDDQASQDEYPAALVLNQNLYATTALYPQAPRCRLLLGPSFALLRKEFREVEARAHRRRGPAKIVVTMGGSDPHGATALAAQAAIAARADASVTVVIGPGHADADRAVTQARRLDFSVVRDPPNISAILADADLVVTGSGTSVLELLRIGVPFIGIVLADNQEPVARALRERARVTTIDGRPGIDLNELSGAITRMLSGDGLSTDSPPPDSTLVDGTGATKVAEIMADRDIRLRPPTESDGPWLFGLANDPAVRKASFSQAKIDWATHAEWLRSKLRDRLTVMWLVERGNTPIGVVRFEARDSGAEISVSLAAVARGSGLGAWLIAEATRRYMREVTGPPRIIARIRSENAGSARAFASAGFDIVAPDKASRHGNALEFELRRATVA